MGWGEGGGLEGGGGCRELLQTDKAAHLGSIIPASCPRLDVSRQHNKISLVINTHVSAAAAGCGGWMERREGGGGGE